MPAAIGFIKVSLRNCQRYGLPCQSTATHYPRPPPDRPKARWGDDNDLAACSADRRQRRGRRCRSPPAGNFAVAARRRQCDLHAAVGRAALRSEARCSQSAPKSAVTTYVRAPGSFDKPGETGPAPSHGFQAERGQRIVDTLLVKIDDQIERAVAGTLLSFWACRPSRRHTRSRTKSRAVALYDSSLGSAGQA